MQNPEVLPQKKEAVVAHNLGDEVFLHDENNKLIHVLNCTARYIYERCDGTTTIEDLKQLMAKEFEDIDMESLREDILGILSEFHDKGLVS